MPAVRFGLDPAMSRWRRRRVSGKFDCKTAKLTPNDPLQSEQKKL
jgi:hypothetical protein